MSQLPLEFGHILFADSYVLGFFRNGRDIVIDMEFTLVSGGLGNLVPGQIIFPDVDKEEWRDGTAKPSSMETINQRAHRYYGGADERPDLGTIISVEFTADGDRRVVGDWGECILRAHSEPRIILSGTAMSAVH